MPGSHWQDAPDDGHHPAAARGASLAGAELDADLAERGYPDLRPGHAALFLVGGSPLGLAADRSGRQSALTKQAMMAMVDDLEARGYVRRVPDPADARAKLVRLTARGRRPRPSAAGRCRRVEQRTRRQLGDRRYDALREALEVLSELARASSSSRDAG